MSKDEAMPGWVILPTLGLKHPDRENLSGTPSLLVADPRGGKVFAIHDQTEGREAEGRAEVLHVYDPVAGVWEGRSPGLWENNAWTNLSRDHFVLCGHRALWINDRIYFAARFSEAGRQRPHLLTYDVDADRLTRVTPELPWQPWCLLEADEEVIALSPETNGMRSVCRYDTRLGEFFRNSDDSLQEVRLSTDFLPSTPRTLTSIGKTIFSFCDGQVFARNMAATRPQWRRRGPMPTLRLDATAVAVGGEVWLIGGRLAHDPSATMSLSPTPKTSLVEAFIPDRIRNRWETLRPLPFAGLNVAASQVRRVLVDKPAAGRIGLPTVDHMVYVLGQQEETRDYPFCAVSARAAIAAAEQFRLRPSEMLPKGE